jgi:hypothetical protein
MEETWKMYSTEIIGYIAPQTRGNEEYVVMGKVTKWLEEGLTAYQIGLKWNHPVALVYGCSAGVNKMGVEYDSCEYANTIAAAIK